MEQLHGDHLLLLGGGVQAGAAHRPGPRPHLSLQGLEDTVHSTQYVPVAVRECRQD
jgi:hypothetical protein